MQVQQAKEIARQWVREEGVKTPGFAGAFFHGSVNWLTDDADLPASSDLDVMIVLDGPVPSHKLGKFVHSNVLMEVSYLPGAEVQSSEQVLANYPLAGSFRTPGVIADPSGHLTDLQIAVARDYAKRSWVRKRIEGAISNIRRFLEPQDESSPLHDQVNAWSFAAGVTTHVLLVAGLKNPTVRTRYLTVKELLTEYRLDAFYESLLEMLGCAHMSRKRAERHLAALTEAFDTAATALKTLYRFAADISESGRRVTIDGSREMIEQGNHREAIFWMLATYSRCQWVLAQDAPIETQERFSIGYRRLLADLGIISFTDLRRRCVQVRESLPAIWAVAEIILAANPEIEADAPPTLQYPSQ